MAAAFPQEATAIEFQVADEIDPLHARLRREPLADYFDPAKLFFRQRAVGFEHEFDGYP